MSFRLVPNSVTLDDLERRNSHIRSVISPNSVTFGADYVKVVEDTPVLRLLQRKCRPENLVFSDISFVAIFAKVTPSESDKVRHSSLVRENVTNNQP